MTQYLSSSLGEVSLLCGRGLVRAVRQGSEVPLLPPLPAAGPGQGDQAGLSKLRKPRQAEIPENPPEKPLRGNPDINLCKLPYSQPGNKQVQVCTGVAQL